MATQALRLSPVEHRPQSPCQDPQYREKSAGCVNTAIQNDWGSKIVIPKIPSLPAPTDSKGKGKLVFTVDHALMATKNYHLRSKIVEISPTPAAIQALTSAATDIAYLYDNIELAEPLARQIMQCFIDIWNFEAQLLNKAVPQV